VRGAARSNRNVSLRASLGQPQANGPRILYAVTVPLTAAAFLVGQFKALINRGHELHLLTSPEPNEAITQIQAAINVPMQLVSMRREMSPLADLVSLGHIWLALRRVRPMISNVGTPKAALLVGLVAALQRVPLRIYTMHGLRYETVAGTRRQVLKAVEQLTCMLAHHVVAVSPSLRARAINEGLVNAERISVLGHGSISGVAVAPTIDQSALSVLRASLGLTDQTVVIGYVGRLVKDKGIVELMVAFLAVLTHFPDTRLLLVGGHDHTDAIDSELYRQIEDHPQIISVGHVHDVTPYYALMSLFVLPTYREGFPMVTLEAAASGLPVVTTDATGAVDAVVPGVTGLRVPVADAEALSAAFERLLADEHLRAEYGRQGQRWVRENFSPDTVESSWVALYKELWERTLRRRRYRWKRVIDVIGAGGGLLALCLPLIILALVVRVKLGSPILFTQIRPGLDAVPFKMYKFRTMTDTRNVHGNLLPDAERLTSLGKFLRATSLDELPELFNVLRGEMSLVGPRPLLVEYLPLYTARQSRRHELRPGVTGWAQVNGRNAISWEEKFDLDVWYIEHVSLILDLAILLRTFKKVVHREGISAAGEATMARFTGRHSSEKMLDGIVVQ
jgi:lipopolysaccharide/colanic/teichoic acid biosynthesis glycosyltransferase